MKWFSDYKYWAASFLTHWYETIARSSVTATDDACQEESTQEVSPPQKTLRLENTGIFVKGEFKSASQHEVCSLCLDCACLADEWAGCSCTHEHWYQDGRQICPGFYHIFGCLSCLPLGLADRRLLWGTLDPSKTLSQGVCHPPCLVLRSGISFLCWSCYLFPLSSRYPCPILSQVLHSSKTSLS